MQDILAELLTYLTDELITKTNYLASVQVSGPNLFSKLVNYANTPALVITGLDENHEQGPFTNSAREVFSVSLFLIAQTTDPQAYWLDPISGITYSLNIYGLVRYIREVLYKRKRITTETFEMRPGFTVEYVTIVDGAEGVYAGGKIRVQYTKLERYDGMANSQPDLVPPPPVHATSF